MSTHLCPACRYPNGPWARRCEVCGAALGDGDTVPTPLTVTRVPEADVDAPVSALWIDELGLASAVPRSAGGAAARLPDVVVREIRLPARAVPALPSTRASGLVSGMAFPPLQPAPPSPPAVQMPAFPAPPAQAPLPTDRAARAVIKVARRAAVRRARQASAGPLQDVHDVLVMDADATARNELDDLLGALGFRVRPVATLGQAALLAGFHPFSAVFVAVPPGAIDGAVHDLFERAREVNQHMGLAPAVRVLVAARWSPEDRVRAELAGCEATLGRPVTRRDIARVLDANGVALPRDPRRA